MKNTIKKIISDKNFILGDINIIFVNERRIKELNKKYLTHDYITDVITFDYNLNNCISGDIYICPFQAKRNAEEFQETPEKEYNRLVIHGVLHLVGFDDKEEKQKLEMTEKENYYLN